MIQGDDTRQRLCIDTPATGDAHECQTCSQSERLRQIIMEACGIEQLPTAKLQT